MCSLSYANYTLNKAVSFFKNEDLLSKQFCYKDLVYIINKTGSVSAVMAHALVTRVGFN